MTTLEIHHIIDAIIHTLYNNMDKDGMHLERQILWPRKIKINSKDSNRLWDILLSTGLVTPIVGFGNEGKLEITPAGIQMMTRYGSYKDFLASQQIGLQQGAPQISIQLRSAADDNEEPSPETPPIPAPSPNEPKPTLPQKPQKSKRAANPSK